MSSGKIIVETKERKLKTSVNVSWKKGMVGDHKPIRFEGPFTVDRDAKKYKLGTVDPTFFSVNPDPVECFFSFIPVTFFDDVALWTNRKFILKGEKVRQIRRDEILGIFVTWFIMGLIKLPSVNSYFKLGLGNLLKLLNIEKRDETNLLSQFRYNQIAGSLQWNKPVIPSARLDKDGKADFLYLIRPLLNIMQKKFPLAWIPSVDLTVDKSLWSFKGRTYLKRFMKDKPKKYSFLEYALCTLGGYFYAVLVHHLPGKAKRLKRGLHFKSLDNNNQVQLLLQEQYGEQGEILMRLVSELKLNGHHIVGDDAFSSVQLVHDLKIVKIPLQNLTICKCDYTGT